MKSIIAIGIAVIFLFLPGCPKKITKEDKEKVTQEKEQPAWAKFPFPSPDDTEKEEDE